MGELINVSQGKEGNLILILENKKNGVVERVQGIFPIKKGRISYPSRLKSKIVEAIIPEGIEEIEDQPYYREGSNIEAIAIRKLFSLASHDFSNCGNLRKIRLPESLKNIGNIAFLNCRSLEEIEFPKELQRIGAYCFQNCSALTSIDIPNSVMNIEDRAFSICSNIENAHLPQGMNTIKKGTFYNCSKLKDINISNSILTIDDEAFFGCSSLKVNLPDQIKKIGLFAFSRCNSLTELKLPDKLRYLGAEAFADCENLKVVHIGSWLPPYEKRCDSFGDEIFNPFLGCTSIEEVIVPAGRKYYYRDYFHPFTKFKYSLPTSNKNIAVQVKDRANGRANEIENGISDDEGR